MGQGEGLNLKINEEPVQLACFISDRTEKQQRENQKPLLGHYGVNRPLCFNHFQEPPLADPHEGWCGGWRLDTSGYPISSLLLQPFD